MRSQFTPLGNVFIVIIFVAMAGVATFISLSKKPIVEESEVKPETQAVIPIPPPRSITLGFVGDIMVHTPMASSAQSADGRYDFDEMFRYIKDITTRPDVMVGNLETPITGETTISGYPNFNAPVEILATLSNIGFDALQITNNHSLDQGVKGLANTIDVVAANGFTPIGGTLFESMAYEPVIQTSNGITVAFIAATYGFNGYTLPKDKTHLANQIDIDKITTSIQSARNQGADIVIVMPHFGIEYQRAPSDDQQKTVNSLVQAGADAIIGSHPHVIQQTEERIGPNGNKIYIAYSLGNFISNQQDEFTDLGLMVSLTYSKSRETGKITLSGVEETPIYTHKYRSTSKRHFEVVPLAEALALPDLTPEDIRRIEKYNTQMGTVFEPAIPVTPPESQ